jgi:hypothetical protein
MICSSEKRQFGSAQQARRSNRHARFRIHAYLCPECHFWHVSNGDKR